MEKLPKDIKQILNTIFLDHLDPNDFILQLFEIQDLLINKGNMIALQNVDILKNKKK